MRVQEGLWGFRCLICSLSGPCELLFLLCFIAPWTWEVVSIMLFCVALPINLFVLCVAWLTVFLNCLVKQFALCLGVFVVLLLNVMYLLFVVGGALLDRPCMIFHRMCVLCLWSQWASRCSFHMLCLCFCMSEVISSFRWLLFLCCFFVWVYILCIRVRACNCYASFALVCWTCLPSVWCLLKFGRHVYINGYGGLRENGLCVFRELCPVSFLVVGECPSVVL